MRSEMEQHYTSLLNIVTPAAYHIETTMDKNTRLNS